MNLYPKALLLLCLSSTVFAGAMPDDNCANPFEGMSQTFLLQGLVNTDPSENSLPLRISNASRASYEPVGSTSYYFQTRCVDEIKSIALWYGLAQLNPISQTEPIEDEPGRFTIESPCEGGQVSFILDTNNKTLSQTSEVELVYSVYDSNEKPLFYVFNSGDKKDEVIFQSPNGTVLAKTFKSYLQKDSFHYVNWLVENTGADPAAIAYILSWKESQDLNCWYKDDPWVEAKIAAAGILLTTGAGLLVLGSTLGRKNQPESFTEYNKL